MEFCDLKEMHKFNFWGSIRNAVDFVLGDTLFKIYQNCS